MRNKSVTCWGLRAVRSAMEGSAVSFSCISVMLSSTRLGDSNPYFYCIALILIYTSQVTLLRPGLNRTQIQW